MTTRPVVQLVGLGLAIVAGAAAARQPAASPPADAAWRAVVVDVASRTLLLLDAAAPVPVRVGPALPGVVLELRDPSRLVLLHAGDGGATATVFSDAPARTLGPVPLGDCVLPGVNAPAFALERFRDRIVVEAPNHLVLACWRAVVSLDLERGTVAAQPLERPTALLSLGGSRVLAVSSAREGRPRSTDVAIYDARTLDVRARARVDGTLVDPVLVSGGAEIVAIGFGDELAPDQPVTLRYLDAHTAVQTRIVPLGALRSTRLSADGRFAYATNMNRNTPKQTARELRVVRVDTGEVLETVSLLEHSSWYVPLSGVDRGLPPMIESRRLKEPALSRLLVLDEGRVRATLPMHGFVHQLSVDRERGRMYLLDGRGLTVCTWPDLRVEQQVAVGAALDWGGQSSLSLAPGAARALVVSGSRAVAIDLVAGRALPDARLGSSAARARRFWGMVGVAPFVLMSQGPVGAARPPLVPGSSFDPVEVAFSADGQVAMLPAPTGQITAIDMTTGRALRHVPGGDGAIAFAGVPLIVAADRQSSWVLDVASGEVVARVAVSAADADAPLSTSISPDGRFLLIGRGPAVHLLDARTGRSLSAWSGLGRIAAVRFLRTVPRS